MPSTTAASSKTAQTAVPAGAAQCCLQPMSRLICAHNIARRFMTARRRPVAAPDGVQALSPQVGTDLLQKDDSRAVRRHVGKVQPGQLCQLSLAANSRNKCVGRSTWDGSL